MNEIATPQRTHATIGRALSGWLALLLLPWLLIGDTLWAMQSGWPLAAAGTFRVFFYLAVTAVALATCGLLLRPFRRWLGAFSGRLWLLALGAVAGLLIGEWFVIPWVSPRASFHRRMPLAVYTFTPSPLDLPGAMGDAHSTMNRDGIRGPEMPPRDEAYRILCVGGGAVESLYLDDDESFTGQLQKQLELAGGRNHWVGGAGITDLASGHHLRFLRDDPLVGEVDCVVLMAGVNDLLRLVMGYDMGEGTPPLWYRSNLVDLLREIWLYHREHGVVVDRAGRFIYEKRYGRPIDEPQQPLDLDRAIEAFGARIAEICDICQARGIRLVLVSQPALWDFDLTPQAKKRLRFTRTVSPRRWTMLRADVFRELMDRYNAQLERVAKEKGVEWVDASSHMSGRELFFIDDFDLSEGGAFLLAKLVAEPLKGISNEAAMKPAQDEPVAGADSGADAEASQADE